MVGQMKPMKRALCFLTAAILTAAPLATPLAAQQIETDVVVSELLPGWRMENGQHMAALRISLTPGWKTFWRAPGDAGLPAVFDTSASTNIESFRTIWPRPDVFEVAGMQAIGYKSEIILPFEITAANASAPARLTGQVQIGVCKEVCVPATLTFDTELPQAGSRDARILAALVDVPFTSEEIGVSEVACFTGPVQYGLGLRAEITMPQLPGQEHVAFEASDPEIWFAEARTWWEGGRLIAETEMAHATERAITVDGSDLRLTVIGSGQAVDIRGCALR